MQLSPVEARVLGSLIEKEISTPEYYPLSLNALLAACNQKSSREPVMTLGEDDVRGALRSLEDAELVSIDHGSRVQRYEHRARTVFHLRRDETAIVCLLLLRGPQTAGELRSRSDRLFVFDDLAAVNSALTRLGAASDQRAEPLVVQLPRGAGAKEQRYALTLAEVSERVPATVETAPLMQKIDLEERVRRLEAAVEELTRLVESLQP
jgi:uncharacterized protein YceH (UPF0502 family)